MDNRGRENYSKTLVRSKYYYKMVATILICDNVAAVIVPSLFKYTSVLLARQEPFTQYSVEFLNQYAVILNHHNVFACTNTNSLGVIITVHHCIISYFKKLTLS